MFCSICGGKVSDSDKFCRSCGAAVDASEDSSVDAASPSALGAQAQSDAAASSVFSDLLSAVKICFRKYFNGHGRASQREYWYWMFLLALIIGAARVVDVAAFIVATLQENGTALSFDVPAPVTTCLTWLSWIAYGLALVCLCPTISLFVRRCHDINRAGWWTLAVIPTLIIPSLSLIFAGVLGVISGTPGSNRYGPDPEE